MKENEGKISPPAGKAAAAAGAPVNPLCALIAKQPFFKGLTPQQFQVLAGLAMEKQFKAGEFIMREGDPANRFYLILEGKVDLRIESGGKDRLPVQMVGPGEDLGWAWLFPPYYFHGTAQAIEPVRAIFFYGTRLRQKCEEDHDLGYELMKRVAQVAIRNLNSASRNLELVSPKDRPPRAERK